MASQAPKRLRCAIYTRKSTEEGLEQAFNSLDAQREACASYVLSQCHEGWALAPDLYDDGGFTGGNMDRPALKQLLADVRAGRVDVVVVYKVDRLTRSLADFAKIVEVLDEAGASFVSVTQAFNTSNSMGRLTLNVLLSFAQFEREVISERIRDKVAASKARGIWMGGPVALGYRVEDRKLIVVPEEAERVRHIMRRYLESKNIFDLLDQLERERVVSKVTVGRDGTLRGGVPFRRGALYHLLSNRTYLGLTVHKGKAYPGQHEAIVDQELFDAVQAKLAERTHPRSSARAKRCVSLLAGMIHDEHGRPMSPIHTQNHGRRYSYYASNAGDGSKDLALRLPAGELDAATKAALASLLGNPHALREKLGDLEPSHVFALADHCTDLAERLRSMSTAEVRDLLKRLTLTVRVAREHATASIGANALLALVEIQSDSDQRVTLSLPTTTTFYGHEQRLRLDPPASQAAARNARLVELIARGFAARDHLLAMNPDQVTAMPTTQYRHLERIARLAYLAPDIVRGVMDGRQPRSLNARTLARLGSLPLDWAEQRTKLGFASH